LEGVAHADDLHDLGVAVGRRIEPDGPLQFLDEVGEDRSHRLEDLACVLAGRRRPLQLLSLRKRQLERLHQRLREGVASDLHGARPERIPRGDDQVRVLGADIQEDRRFVREHAVEIGRVVHGQRGRLYRDRLDRRLLEMQQVLANQLPLHGEDPDLQVRKPLLLECLVVPDHLIQVERNLLIGFIPDNVRNPLRRHRRQLGEPGQGMLARDVDHDLVLGDVAAREKLLERTADQGGSIRVRLRENLCVLDVIHVEDVDPAVG